MRRRGKWGVVLTTLWLTTFHFTTLYASSSQLKEGNRQFKNGHYDKALKLYEDALIDSPYSSALHFNAGNASFMMGDFSKAEDSYMEAAKSANPILRGASHYNRGHAFFYQRKWAEAVEAYKEALRANPRDQDAKYNLGVALKALKNPPPPQQSGQGQGKQDQKQNSGGQKQNPSAQKSGDDKKQEGQSNQPQPGQMSKENAEQLLAAAGAGEKKKSSQKMQKGEVPHPDEDW